MINELLNIKVADHDTVGIKNMNSCSWQLMRTPFMKRRATPKGTMHNKSIWAELSVFFQSPLQVSLLKS